MASADNVTVTAVWQTTRATGFIWHGILLEKFEGAAV